jgi:hypothetical protein
MEFEGKYCSNGYETKKMHDNKYKDIAFVLESKGFYLEGVCFWKKLTENMSFKIYINNFLEIFISLFSFENRVLLEMTRSEHRLVTVIDLIEDNLFVFSCLTQMIGEHAFFIDVIPDEFKVIEIFLGIENYRIFIKRDELGFTLFSKL